MRRHARDRCALLALSMIGAACGDPIVGAPYRGEPILRLTGQVQSVGPVPVQIGEGESALVSIFWNPDLSHMPPKLLAQNSISAAIQFPSSFEIRIFDPPVAADLVQSDGRFGIGVLLVYIDKNKDGAFDDGDNLIGGNLAKALVWATQAIPANETPFGAAIPEGFSIINQPFAACVGPPPGTGIAAPIGSAGPHVHACTSDASCPAEFTCDPMFAVCVPKDSFKIVIGGDFTLAHAGCPPPR